MLAAADLDGVAARMRAELGLGEPYSDPGVALFGLRNAVFALGDQFLEVVSPVDSGTAAARRLERLGDDGGYMVMLQVDDLPAARDRVQAAGIREVWGIELDDISETHLHPADIGGAIVSLSAPRPPEGWRWGGEGWARRAVPGGIAGVTVEVAAPAVAEERWSAVAGSPVATAGVSFRAGERERGLVELAVRAPGLAEPRELGGVRFVPADRGAG